MRRSTLTILAIALLGVPLLLSGILAWSAVPRGACDWSGQFCSDYGAFYGAACALFAGGLMSSLWAIHRRREG